ncbi:hypothetical protein [Nonomuraea typhae]|uniref:XRE family transcriptional regulator n=1 Tax=Nonomuraea typhae TaxID=2603600 RepID=A0ABW7YMS2_9ACTN
MVREANEALKAARESLASPTAPGQPMSRQEVADLVNAWIYEKYGRESCLTANYVGKLERGAVSWPQADYREALRAILGAKADYDLGFRRHRRAPTAPPVREVGDVDRKAFLQTALGAAASVSLTDLAMLGHAVEIPLTVQPADIQEIRHVAATFSSWDHTYGGAMARVAVIAQLNHCADILRRSRCPKVFRADLYSAVGWLANSAAFMAFDSYAHDDARRMFNFGLSCAEEAGDWNLRAKVLSSMARQEIWVGDADTGLTLVELALVRADRLSAAVRAMLLSTRARALAKLGRIQETLATVGLADGSFAVIPRSSIDPLMRYYDAAQHSGDTGHALFDLAIRGRFVGEASQRLSAAVDGHAPLYVRSRAISRLKLSSLTMAMGDPDEAAAIGTQAVQEAGAVRSCRVIDDMRELDEFAKSHDRRSPVAHLRQHIKGAIQR